MTAGFKGGVTFERLDTSVSPNVYETIEEAMSISGVGKTNPLVDTTSFDSAAREYIAGLADGQEITIECVRVHTAANRQDDLVSDIDAGLTKTFRLTVTNTLVSPNLSKTYVFQAVCLSWAVGPSFDDANKINFTLKISGDITIT